MQPDPIVSVADWAEEKRFVSGESGSPRPGKWANDLVPYLREVMEVLSPSHPCREVVARKGAQLGFSEAGLNLFGTVVDTAPAPMLIVLPTDGELKKYNRLKLDPTIQATPALKGKVQEPRSRTEKGSTVSFKSFPGGYAVLTCASASSGLQMISVKIIIFEEVSEYPDDVEGRGDPVSQALARSDAYAAERKVYYCSTPGVAPNCRITKKYEASDQRRYYVPCPHCGAFILLDAKRLTWDERRSRPPFGAEHVCPACDEKIAHEHKRAMVAQGRWVPSFPTADGEVPNDHLTAEELERWCARDREGREPGFALGQVYSPFKSWDDIVERDLASRDNPRERRAYVQQVLGEAWKGVGEAPPWEVLYARREEFPPHRIPARALVLTGGIDVQGDRIEAEVVAWAPGMESWSIAYDVLPGNTALPQVWQDLDAWLERHYEDAWGRAWPVDLAAIDSGYQTRMVHAWAARHSRRAMATKGMPGDRPYLAPGGKVRLTFSGRKVGGRLWLVGTWRTKSDLYDALRLPPPDEGKAFANFCHFPAAYADTYFKQLTSETVVEHVRRGIRVREWDLPAGVRNEALDCRVGAMAAAARLGLFEWTADRWLQRRIERGADAPVPEEGEGDAALPLFARETARTAARLAEVLANPQGALAPPAAAKKSGSIASRLA